jgi:hypothetical protein
MAPRKRSNAITSRNAKALKKTDDSVKDTGKDDDAKIKNQKGGSGAKSCPLQDNTDHPCDIERLVLHGMVGGKSKVSAECLEVRANRRKPPAKKPPDKDRIALMDRYDLILEVPSKPVTPDSGTGHAFLALERSLIGDCPKDPGKHPHLQLNFVNPDPGDTVAAPATWNDPDVSSQEMLPIPPKTLPIDKRNRFFLADLRDIFRFRQCPIKEVELRLLSCGVRAKGKPNKFIKGLVRVYRDEEWKLSLNIPSLKKFEKSEAATRQYNTKDGTKESTTRTEFSGDSTTTGTKGGQAFSSQTRDGVTRDSDGSIAVEVDNYFHKQVVKVDADGNVEKSFSMKPKLVLSRNGTEIDFTEILNTIINIKNLLSDGIDSVQRFVPQVGYTWSLSFSFLEGNIDMSWGVRSDPAISLPQYQWVSRYGDYSINVQLIRIAFNFGYGVDVTSPAILNWFGRKAYELVLKIALEISLALRMSKTGTLFGPKNTDIYQKDEVVVVTGTAESKGDLYLQFTAMVAGYGVDSRAGIQAGLTISASIVVPFNVKGEFKRNQGLVYAYFNHPFKRKPSPRWEYELWSDKVIKEGYFLEKSGGK